MDNPITQAQDKFIQDLLDSVTISQALKDSIVLWSHTTDVTLPEASRLIKALIELDIDYLVKKYLEGENG